VSEQYEGLSAMICDVETGVCGPAADAAESQAQPIQVLQPAKKVDVYYVTDPICSHCWAIEPVLRRFGHEYGRHVNVKTVMGGLLPGWDGFADRANGIGKAADVAGHWREVGEASRMPIDGSVWVRDPLSSSFPPSKVFLVIQEQDAELAGRFLRKAREAVFAFDRNIADREVLTELVNDLGLNGEAVVEEALSERGEELLNRDIAFARELGVRGFPTLVFVDDDGRGERVVGMRPLQQYADTLQRVMGEDATVRTRALLPLDELLASEGRLFAKEIETYYGIEPGAAEEYVAQHLGSQAYRSKEILGETLFEAA